MSALAVAAIAALLTMAAWAYVEAGRARLLGWALWHPEDATDLFAELAEGRRRARLHAALVVLTWPVSLRHLPAVDLMAHALKNRSSWEVMGLRIVVRPETCAPSAVPFPWKEQ